MFNFEPSETDNSVTLQKSFKKVTVDGFCWHIQSLVTDHSFFPPSNHCFLAQWAAPLRVYKQLFANTFLLEESEEQKGIFKESCGFRVAILKPVFIRNQSCFKFLLQY